MRFGVDASGEGTAATGTQLKGAHRPCLGGMVTWLVGQRNSMSFVSFWLGNQRTHGLFTQVAL